MKVVSYNHECTNFFCHEGAKARSTTKGGFTQSSQGGRDAIVFCHEGTKTQRFTKSIIPIAPLSLGRGVGGEVKKTALLPEERFQKYIIQSKSRSNPSKT